MEIVKNALSVGKKIRIRNDTKSKSKEKRDSIEKNEQKNENFVNIRTQIGNAARNNCSSIIKLIMSKKNTPPKQKYQIKLSMVNHNKLSLNQKKETIEKPRSSPLKQNSNIQYSLKSWPQQKYISFSLSKNPHTNIHSAPDNIEQNLALIDEKNLLCPENVTSSKKLSAFNQQYCQQKGNQKSSFIQTQNFNSINCNDIHKLRGIHFHIQKTISIQITSSFGQSKQSFATQTIETTIDDKYYLSYMKYRLLKEKSYNEMILKEQKIHSIIQQTEDFDKKHSELINYIKSGPSNDRQKRIFGLRTDLENQQKKLKEIFSRIQTSSKSFEVDVIQKINSSSSQSLTLISSIESLLKVCLTQLKFQASDSTIDDHEDRKPKQSSSNNKIHRILNRLLSQFKNFKKIFFYFRNLDRSIIQKYRQETFSLKKEYDTLESLQYENRVLLYNFIQQLNKIPALTSSLFGHHQNEENTQEKTHKKTDEEKRFDEYMTVNCEKCYEMKRKIDMIKINNTRIRPYFKVTEWLVRDVNKRKHLLQFI